MKKTGKKSFKIVAATGMTIFSLFACFYASFAWFMSNNKVENPTSGFNVQSDSSEITTISCYAIQYDGIYGASATRLVSGQPHNISMSEYDYILRDKNVNTPLFLRIEMAGFNKTKDLQISIPCSGAYKTGNNAYIDNNLSNVVCTKFSYGLLVNGNVVKDDYDLTGDPEDDAEAASTIYTGMRDRMAGVDGTPFVVSSSQKNSVVTLTLNHENVYDPNFLMETTLDGNTVEKVVIYLEFDYYVTNTVNLVEDYVESYEDAGIEHNNRFYSDIGIISLKDIG